MKLIATILLGLIVGFGSNVNAQTTRIYQGIVKPSPITKSNLQIPHSSSPQSTLAATDDISYFDTTNGNIIFGDLPFWIDDTTAYVGYGERFTCSSLSPFTVDSVEFVMAPLTFEDRPGNKVLLTLHKRGPDFNGNAYANFTWVDTAQVLAGGVQDAIGTAFDTTVSFLHKTKPKFTKSSPDFWIYAKLPDTTGDQVRILMDATEDDPANHTSPFPDGDRSYVWFLTPSNIYQAFLGGRFQNTMTQGVLYNQLVMVAHVSGTSLGVTQDSKGNSLAQNYPNPIYSSSEIWYSLGQSERVSLKVYNALGIEVSVIANDFETAGDHQVSFNADNLPSGTYYYTLRAGDFTATKQMIVTK